MKKRSLKYVLIPGLLIGALGMSSCSNASHLVLYQKSNLGLNTAINPATQNLHVRLGLRREFGAIVPKYQSVPTGDEVSKPKAASAYFGSRARVTHPWRVPEVADVLVTGRAATIVAQAGNALDFADTPVANGTNPDDDQ